MNTIDYIEITQILLRDEKFYLILNEDPTKMYNLEVKKVLDEMLCRVGNWRIL